MSVKKLQPVKGQHLQPGEPARACTGNPNGGIVPRLRDLLVLSRRHNTTLAGIAGTVRAVDGHAIGCAEPDPCDLAGLVRSLENELTAAEATAREIAAELDDSGSDEA